MSFPKLPKTPLDTNEFNYNRWTNTTCKVKLCSVPWSDTYEHVVEFSSVADRDAYFNGLVGNDITIDSGFRVVDKHIKVPTPYFNAIRYNYVVIDYPIPTSATDPVDYATLEPRTLKYFYFIRDIEDLAPNTCLINLEEDVWQQWYYDLDIKSIYLKRGHYAIAHSKKPSEFIQNPITSTDYLLAPEDVPISSKKKEPSAVFEPYYSVESKLYALFALPFDISALIDSDIINDFEYPIFTTDETTRNGYFAISSFSLPSLKDNIEYQSLNAVSTNITNTYYYAVELEDLPELSNKQYILIAQNIHSVYILSDDYITLSKIDDSIFYSCSLKAKETNVLTSDVLAEYANKVNGFTKLLTAPYCTITITDYNTTYNIEPQLCSEDIEIINNIIFADNDIKGMSRITNLGAAAEQTVYIKRINGTQEYKTLFNSFDYDYIFNIDLPVYGLFVDGSTKELLNKAYENVIKENDLRVNYENSARKANTDYENTKATIATNYSNATSSIETTYTNAKNSNELTNSIEKNTGSCNRDNAKRSNNNAEAVGNASARNTFNCSVASNNTTEANVKCTNRAVTANATLTQTKNTAVALANTTLNYGTYIDNFARTNAAAQAQNDLQDNIVDIDTVGSAAQAVTGSIANMAGGDLTGALTGAISTIVGIGVQSAKASAIKANNIAMANATNTINQDANTNSETAIEDIRDANNTLIEKTTENTVGASNTNAEKTKETANTNAKNTRDTIIDNNRYTREAGNQNADDTYNNIEANSNNKKSVNDGNAKNVYDCDSDNAEATFNTANANAGYSRDTMLDNLQRSLIKDTENALYATTLNSAKELSALSISKLNTINNLYSQGFIFSVNGLQNDDLQRAINVFNRYGYKVECKDINVTKLQVMKHYTYIECENNTIVNNTVPSMYANIISDVLKRGVTVWSDPTEIGNYNLDNMEV